MNRRDWLLLGAGALLAGKSMPAHAAPRRRLRAHHLLRVEAVRMPAWVTRAGQREPLAPGDIVSTAQVLETGTGAALVLRLPEDSIIRLGENTRLEVLQWQSAADQDGVSVQSRLKLVQGFFRFVSGAVSGLLGKRDIELELRTAAVGIRGTDFWSMTDDEHDAACLFEGRIELATQDQGALVLDKPTAFWARFFKQLAQPLGNATPQQLGKFIASTELKTGSGVAVIGGRWRIAFAVASAAAAKELAGRLRQAGYPGVIRMASSSGRMPHEARVSDLATRQDAEAVLERVSGLAGVAGQVSSG